MSLINDMLKDLDKREPIHHPNPPIAFISQKRLSKHYPLLKYISILFCSLLLLFILISLISYKKIAPPRSFEKENLALTPLPTQDISVWLRPNIVLGLTLQIKQDITELGFILNHATLYRVSTNAHQNQLVLTFEKSRLQSTLPPLEGLNSGLEKIITKEKNGDLIFILTFKANAIVQGINLINELTHPELVLSLKYQSLDEGEYHQQGSIKTPAMQSLLQEQYQKALTEVENHKINLAIKHLTAILAIDPSLNDVRVSLAALLLNNDKEKLAREVINRGLELNPYQVQLIELKARLLANRGKITEALSILLTDPPSIREYPDYYAMIAALYERSNNNVLAINLYRKLLSLNDENGNWWCGLGIALEKQGQIVKAKEAYNRAIVAGNLNSQTISYLQNRLQVKDEGLYATD